MSKSIKLLGWRMSPFTAKVAGYLRHKGLPFNEVSPSALQMHFKIKQKTGRYMIPVVYHPELGVLQDSYDIITTLEQHYNEGYGVIPSTPRQQFVCKLLEAFADVWLIPCALHTRWNTTEKNRIETKYEFGRLACPGFPSFIQKHVGNQIGASMAGYLPILGITQETSDGFDELIRYLLHNLEKHLSLSPFLFGGRPSLADFALMGPLYAHIWLDRWTGWREVMERHENVMIWLRRTHGTIPAESRGEGWLSNDEIPDALLPLLKPVVQDFLPYINTCVEHVNEYCACNTEATRVPRSLGWTDFTMFGYEGRRKVITFDQWKIQSPLQVLQRCEADDKSQIEDLLRSIGAPDTLLDAEVLNTLVRRNYREILDK